MNRSRLAPLARHLAALLLTFALGAGATHAATITIVNLDDPGEGFNDPTPVAPVGGNPGTAVANDHTDIAPGLEVCGRTWLVSLNRDVAERGPSRRTVGNEIARGVINDHVPQQSAVARLRQPQLDHRAI